MMVLGYLAYTPPLDGGEVIAEISNDGRGPGLEGSICGKMRACSGCVVLRNLVVNQVEISFGMLWSTQLQEV